MPRGDKSKYTDKQERKADHIASIELRELRRFRAKEAERRAWATVNEGQRAAAAGRTVPTRRRG